MLTSWLGRTQGSTWAHLACAEKGKLRDRKWQFNNFTLQNQVNQAELNIFGILSLSRLSAHFAFLSVYSNFDSISSKICESNSKSWAKFKITKYFLCCEIEKFNMNYLWKDWRQRPFRWVFSLFSIAKKRYRMPFRAKFGFLTPFFSLSLMEKSAPHLRVDVSYQPNHFIDTVCVCCLSHSMSVYYSKLEIESTYFKVYTHLLVGISLVRKTKIYRFRYVCVRVLVCVSFETLSHWMFSEANGDPCILLSI